MLNRFVWTIVALPLFGCGGGTTEELQNAGLSESAQTQLSSGNFINQADFTYLQENGFARKDQSHESFRDSIIYVNVAKKYEQASLEFFKSTPEPIIFFDRSGDDVKINNAIDAEATGENGGNHEDEVNSLPENAGFMARFLNDYFGQAIDAKAVLKVGNVFTVITMDAINTDDKHAQVKPWLEDLVTNAKAEQSQKTEEDKVRDLASGESYMDVKRIKLARLTANDGMSMCIPVDIQSGGQIDRTSSIFEGITRINIWFGTKTDKTNGCNGWMRRKDPGTGKYLSGGWYSRNHAWRVAPVKYELQSDVDGSNINATRLDAAILPSGNEINNQRPRQADTYLYINEAVPWLLPIVRTDRPSFGRYKLLHQTTNDYKTVTWNGGLYPQNLSNHKLSYTSIQVDKIRSSKRFNEDFPRDVEGLSRWVFPEHFRNTNDIFSTSDLRPLARDGYRAFSLHSWTVHVPPRLPEYWDKKTSKFLPIRHVKVTLKAGTNLMYRDYGCVDTSLGADMCHIRQGTEKSIWDWSEVALWVPIVNPRDVKAGNY